MEVVAKDSEDGFFNRRDFAFHFCNLTSHV